jgi:hypothetical protein
MYLTKDLMLDWRLGERVRDPAFLISRVFTKITHGQYFSRMLIDSDLASNNGGWQWSSGTGTDPQPYFRIFNPYNQSEKVCCRTPCWRGPIPDNRSRLTRPEITFESSFLSLAACVDQVSGALTNRDVEMLSRFQTFTDPLPGPHRNWGIHYL